MPADYDKKLAAWPATGSNAKAPATIPATMSMSHLVDLIANFMSSSFQGRETKNPSVPEARGAFLTLTAGSVFNPAGNTLHLLNRPSEGKLEENPWGVGLAACRPWR